MVAQTSEGASGDSPDGFQSACYSAASAEAVFYIYGMNNIINNNTKCLWIGENSTYHAICPYCCGDTGRTRPFSPVRDRTPCMRVTSVTSVTSHTGMSESNARAGAHVYTHTLVTLVTLVTALKRRGFWRHQSIPINR
jgi:hypothetical protein